MRAWDDNNLHSNAPYRNLQNSSEFTEFSYFVEHLQTAASGYSAANK